MLRCHRAGRREEDESGSVVNATTAFAVMSLAPIPLDLLFAFRGLRLAKRQSGCNAVSGIGDAITIARTPGEADDTQRGMAINFPMRVTARLSRPLRRVLTNSRANNLG